MNRKFTSFLLFISAAFSAWFYWGSDLKIEQVLTSREWQSKMVTLIGNKQQNDSVGPLRRVDMTSNVKYLPNGTYVRVSIVKLYAVDKTVPEDVINISESGDWDVSDNYLLVSPTEFKDVSSTQSKDFTPQQLDLITQLFKMDSEQSRRIDIVNEKTLLLTSLNHGSTVLFSNG
ncbi:regulatory protein ToxS [Vibrio fluvialis]|uniref:regulatory protein ToxS n=1 Tax=Vibrio fluvialis TaxID=676 RepID=UPI002380A0FE|nr:regulatory protein ToxS [Vibrio fluvialis]WDY53246.1 regulatory protein ToxS [Vibrio fluvialis]